MGERSRIGPDKGGDVAYLRKTAQPAGKRPPAGAAERKGNLMRRSLLLALGSAALLSAAACGSSSGTDTAAPAETGSGPAAEAPAATTTVAGNSDSEPESLDAFFGFDPNDPDASQEQFRQWQMRQEESMARCMINQGFEYVPAVAPSEITAVDFNEESFARERGFGISTQYDVVDANPAEGFVNPNDAIVAAMSDSERQAYYTALYGEETEVEGGDDDLGFGGGCQGEAGREIFGRAEEILRELEPMFDDMQQRVEADPRLADADRGWTACMSDRGYDYDDSDDLFNKALPDLRNRHQEIVGERNPFDGWTEEQINEFYTRSEQEINAFFTQFEEQIRQNVDQEALDALREEEIALATANYECGEERREIVREVTAELEKRFIRDNRDVLNRARDSLNVS